MKRIIAISILAAATLTAVVLAGCSTTRQAQTAGVTERASTRQAQTAGVAEKAVNDQVIKAPARQVAELDLTELFPSDFSGRKVTVNSGTPELITDSEGKITFDMSEGDTITLSFTPCPSLLAPGSVPQAPGSMLPAPDSVPSRSGGTASLGSLPAPSPLLHAPCSLLLATSDWFLPYKYSVKTDGSVERKVPWVEFRSTPPAVTYQPQFEFLCKSEYPATVSINGIEMKQYKTGIFFNTVKFTEGVNKVRAEAVTPDGRSASYEMVFIYEKKDMTRQPYPLWIDGSSFEPAENMELLPEEVVKVRFMASKGQDAYVEMQPGERSIKCLREDFGDYSMYSAEIPLRGFPTGKSYSISVMIDPAAGAPVREAYNPGIVKTVIVRQPEDFPLLKVKNEYSRLVYNLGAPRLGGPVRSELGPGVILKSSGKIGSNYRVRLSNVETGFISSDEVEVMSGSRLQPLYSVTSMSCGPSNGADIVSIPYSEPVAYEVYPDPDGKRLVITIFGAESAATWITHRKGCRIIDKLTWEQTTPETFRVYVNLKSENIWGYDIRPSGKSLLLRIKYPPQYDLANDKPLTGLKIAIEAGHGGSNLGAVGLSGLFEKDINLDLSLRLGELCASKGAEVVQVRDSDKYMLLTEKRTIAISSGADMLISIHANAGGRGYLSVAGTSTYWNNPLWAPLAQAIYDRLLEAGLGEYGVVGSFNYTPIRASQLPAILVEQAFMSHAGDEEKLADPDFRQLEAQKIYEGIIDYLKQMK